MMGNREDFEKWAKKHGVSEFAMTDCGNPIYMSRDVQGCWLTWQARQPEIDAKSKVIDDLALQKGILKAEIGRLESENGALKAEVERLRKIAEPASLFLLSISCSASVSPVFRNIAKGHHEALDAAMKETK